MNSEKIKSFCSEKGLLIKNMLESSLDDDGGDFTIEIISFIVDLSNAGISGAAASVNLCGMKPAKPFSTFPVSSPICWDQAEQTTHQNPLAGLAKTPPFIPMTFPPMKARLLLPLLVASLGTASAVTIPTAFVTYPSLAKSGYSARGAPDITFSTLGIGAISPTGEVLFETRLIGTGSAAGRSRAVFAYRGTDTDLTQFGGTPIGLAGLPPGSKFNSFLSPIHNRNSSSAIFQSTFTGPGINSTNNRVILRDDGGFPSVISRTGVPVPDLSGAIPSSYLEVLQQEGASDRIAIIYKLQRGVASTDSKNDSGLLLMNHAGTVTHASSREGFASFNIPGGTPAEVFGQFGRAAILNGNSVGFICKVIPSGGTPVDSLFHTGLVDFRSVLTQGNTPPGFTGGERLGTFTGVGRINNLPLLRATLTNSPTATNQGVWNSGGTLLLRKGQAIGSATITKILRVWGNNSNQLLAHVQLSNTAQALILRQINGIFFTLISTRAQAPGYISGIDVATLQAIDVDPVSGHYVVLGSLRGVAASENQVLWTGQTTLGNDSTQQNLRLPNVALSKGSLFYSTNTPANTVRGISLRPAIDPTGVGARGFGQQISSTGKTLVTVTGDRRIKELIIVD
jgi:hypothetical protein